MSKTMVFVALCILYSTDTAFAQPDQAACGQLDDGHSLGFVVIPSGSSFVRAPTDEYFAKLGGAYDVSVDYSVCVTLDPLRLSIQPGTVSAVNIRTQTFSYPDPAKSPSPQVFLGLTAQSGYTSISTYQNFHGCRRGKDPQLQKEFHTSVGGRRTDTYPERLKYLFTRDVKEACSIFSAPIAFLEQAVPPSIGRAFADTFADQRTIDPSTIVERRSLNVVVGNQSADTHYLILNLPKLASGRCVRVEGSRVFSDPSDPPQTLGFACVK
jgi:hypothetical protein